MSNAFVTLLTNDEYLPGAMVLGSSLKRVNTRYDTIALVTPHVSDHNVSLLKGTYTHVIKVDEIRSNETRNLQILGRQDLDVTWTKLHAFNPHIIPFDNIVFLDSDTLVIRNIDNVFSYVNDADFAAAPDIGWPDCFNSGVFVTKPSQELYKNLQQHIHSNGSFDGGDQGFLNSFFSNWPLDYDKQDTSKPRTRRLPFLFNVTPSSYYSYLPAFNHYNSDINVIHFIGKLKPWHFDRFNDGSVISKY
jgi:alpha-N-acetylglucosamine transferase